MRRRIWTGTGILLAFLQGCAGMNVERIPDDRADESARGFRYYEEAPFILVYSDGSDGLVSELVYLPDLERKMSARPYQVLAGNKTKLVFSNGVLTSSTSEPDSAVLPKSVVEAAKNVALSIVKRDAFDEARDSKSQNGGGSFEIFPPRIFKLVVSGGNTRLISGSAVASDGSSVVIHVDVPSEQGGS